MFVGPNRDADVGLQLLARSGTIEYTAQEARRVKWKVDFFILPLLCATITLQYLDKVTLSYAAVYGILEDLHLVGQEYSWTSSIYYFGYLAAEPPAAYLIAKCHIWRKEEQGLRVTIWYGFVGLAAILGRLMLYGVGQTHSSIKVWQLIFLVCGSLTVLWSVVLWLFLPADPTPRASSTTASARLPWTVYGTNAQA
ncbi:major facilitator superfamily domain-containing protein [Chaetomium sp. MPI-CAGE-AT-0009]|nr:major facilitator superfamily domain-containing protein [Chaetomium sp. MPI-CAGE-AT-0009]